MTNFTFQFDLSELPAVAIAVLSSWQVWQAMYSELLEATTVDDAVDMLADAGYLSYDLNY